MGVFSCDSNSEMLFPEHFSIARYGVVEYSGKGSLGSAKGFMFKRCERGEALAEESLNLSLWPLVVGQMCGVAATQLGS